MRYYRCTFIRRLIKMITDIPNINGKFVIEKRTMFGDDGYVLGYNESSRTYVTWWYNGSSFNLGHYFTNQNEAYEDFYRRIEIEAHHRADIYRNA